MLHEDLPMSLTQVQIVKGQLHYIAYVQYILCTWIDVQTTLVVNDQRIGI